MPRTEKHKARVRLAMQNAKSLITTARAPEIGATAVYIQMDVPNEDGSVTRYHSRWRSDNPAGVRMSREVSD